MKNKVTAFLPCRKGSQRIPNKNLKKFSVYEFGLFEIKIQQLLLCQNIDTIIVSTNDDALKECALHFKATLDINNRICIDDRPDHLGSSSTSTDELATYIRDKFEFEHLMWTHVTSPFVTADDYNKCIGTYFSALEAGHDSLMTVQTIHSFVWDESGPLNYDRETEKWPRTQTLPAIYEIDSAAFLAPRHVYKKNNDRIGQKPYLLDLKKSLNIDIDWPEQFILAEMLFDLTRAKTAS